MRSSTLAAIALLGALSALTGCSDDYSVALLLQSDPPIEPTLARDRVVIGEGLAVGVRARAMEDDEPAEDDLLVDLASSDTGIVDVRPGIEPNTYVFIGRRRGTATVDAFVDGERARSIDVLVEPQAP